MNNLQWYPGHMARARREIEEATKLVDVVIEIIDARIPLASRNPVLNEIIGNKPRVIVLNKSDLADDNANKQWVEKFKKDNQISLIVNSNTGKGVREVIDKVCEIKKDKIESQTEKGRIGFSIKAMVVGIPNVGKSSFINKVAGKATTAVSNKPGVTKKNQWVRLDDRVQLLDTPGVLWPRLDNQKLAKHLAYIGTIRDEIIDVEDLVMSLLEELCVKYKENIYTRYKISNDFKFESIINLLEEIGRKRGCLIRGNEVDYTKTANIVLDDFRSGKIGKITIE
jgi:ribosome biogenesis GTPase A